MLIITNNYVNSKNNNNLFCRSKIWDNERLPPLRVKTSIAFFAHQLFPQQRTRHRQGGGFWTSKCVHVSTNRLKEPSKGQTFQMFVGYFQTRSLLLHRMILIQCHAILLHYWTQQMTLARSWTPKNWMSISTKALLDNRSAFQRQIAHLGFSSSRFALSAVEGSKKSGWADELIETDPFKAKKWWKHFSFISMSQNLKFKHNKNAELRWQFTWQNQRSHPFSSIYLVLGVVITLNLHL